MPKYVPFHVGVAIRASCSDMVGLRWQRNGLVADFSVLRDERNVLRVQFAEVHVVRILDEMSLSTEAELTPNEGVVPDHFAYRVDGAQFWHTQSDALKAVHKSAEHYRFFTGSTCLDVIASVAPVVIVTPAEAHSPVSD